MPTQARTVELELAIYQSGYTVAAIGHLSGIGLERLASLISGAEPTKQDERHSSVCWHTGSQYSDLRRLVR